MGYVDLESWLKHSLFSFLVASVLNIKCQWLEQLKLDVSPQKDAVTAHLSGNMCAD